MTFDDLGLSQTLTDAVRDCGYSQPTPIQEKAIPPILLGRDVFGCAQTGTGKTAGYTLPMIDILSQGSAKARMARSLVLAPTRELAHQIAASFERYGKYSKLTHAVIIGGEAMAEQERLLDRGVDVLIATPGRLLDLFERGAVMLGGVKILVIDEADRMLDMGFIPDVERIVGLLPRIRQTLMFSATLAPEIRRLADAFLINPKEVSVAPSATVAETVDHKIIRVQDSKKRDVLVSLLRDEPISSAIVFCNRKKDIRPLCAQLKKLGLDAAELHGDLPQAQRTETLAAFKSGQVKLLISSDVAGRGLDIDKVSHVFNHDVPVNPEDYVHRIGRTGRAGRAGRAVTLVGPEEGRQLDAIQRLLGRAIPEAASPLAGASPAAPSRSRRKATPAEAKAPEPIPAPSARPSERRPADRAKRHEAPVRALAPRAAPMVRASLDAAFAGWGDHVPDFLRQPVRPVRAQGVKR
ncbi:MAG: DEAD/DEAH box helicase [Alphaproteobacteria bacterium]|nr:DEAD/DEAH box helicase [Alphaproteobacteria bacterium]